MQEMECVGLECPCAAAQTRFPFGVCAPVFAVVISFIVFVSLLIICVCVTCNTLSTLYEGRPFAPSFSAFDSHLPPFAGFSPDSPSFHVSSTPIPLTPNAFRPFVNEDSPSPMEPTILPDDDEEQEEGKGDDPEGTPDHVEREDVTVGQSDRHEEPLDVVNEILVDTNVDDAIESRVEDPRSGDR